MHQFKCVQFLFLVLSVAESRKVTATNDERESCEGYVHAIHQQVTQLARWIKSYRTRPTFPWMTTTSRFAINTSHIEVMTTESSDKSREAWRYRNGLTDQEKSVDNVPETGRRGIRVARARFVMKPRKRMAGACRVYEKSVRVHEAATTRSKT